jgi:hypothetical protein
MRHQQAVERIACRRKGGSSTTQRSCSARSLAATLARVRSRPTSIRNWSSRRLAGDMYRRTGFPYGVKRRLDSSTPL